MEEHDWRTVMTGMFFFAGLAAIGFMALSQCGCGPWAERAGNAVDLGAYQAALDKCREQGKAVKSYDVYETCAQKADHMFIDGGK